MKITREKPCQRRHHRLTAPLYVRVDNGPTLAAKDWSLGGLQLTNFAGEIPALYQEVNLTLDIPFQGFDIAFEVTGKVLRIISETRSICIEFTGLSERASDLMNHFVEDLVRGKMATVDDTICRIDVPVTPISTSPTANPTEVMPVNRLPLKTIIMTSTYLIVGVFVFVYLGVLIYAKFYRLEVSTSVVSSRIQTIKMPSQGSLKPTNITVGQHFIKGQEIFRIEDQKLNEKISNVHLKIKESEAKLWEVKEKYRIETERMKLYQIVSNTDRNIIKAQLAAKQQELASADSHLIRLTKLKKSNAISQDHLDDAKNRQKQFEFQYQELQAKLVQASAMQSVSARKHYNHKVFATDLDMLAIELQTAYSKLDINKLSLDNLLLAQKSQIVRAPYNGKIINLYQVVDSSIAKNSPILTIEETDQIKITAFLNQEEIALIGLNDQASVYIPALAKRLPAIVTHINRSSLFIDRKEVRYGWRQNDQRTAIVSLTLFANDRDLEGMNAGLPAVVIFKRRSQGNLISEIFGVINSVDKQLKTGNQVYDSEHNNEI